MIFEMRQYFVARGRMADSHDRMRNHLPDLFAKHRIRVAARWTAVAGARLPMFCYMMQWDDLAERETGWAAFYADPEWARIRTLTNAGSELVEGQELVFLRPHPALPLHTGAAPARIGGLHQLITQKVLVGRNAEVAGFLHDTYLPRLRAAGAGVTGLFDMISGPGMPNLVLALAWADETAWRRGWAAFDADDEVRAAFERQRGEFGATLFAGSDGLLLEPAPYALPYASLTARLDRNGTAV